jgi:hypothetical protein
LNFKVLASSSYEGSVIIHREVRPGEWSVVTWRKAAASVNSVKWDPFEHGALMLACASSDGTVSVLKHDAATDGKGDAGEEAGLFQLRGLESRRSVQSHDARHWLWKILLVLTP